MAARIKQLETALANAENGPLALAALDDGQGSLQDCEPNAVEYEGELDRVSKFMGSLAITSEGKGHYYGATAGPEVRASSIDLSPSYSYLLFYSFCNISCQKFVPVTWHRLMHPKQAFW
jgi:hypothetical protein